MFGHSHFRTCIYASGDAATVLPKAPSLDVDEVAIAVQEPVHLIPNLVVKYKSALREITTDTPIQTLLEPLDELIEVQQRVEPGSAQTSLNLGKFFRWRYSLTFARRDVQKSVEHAKLAVARAESAHLSQEQVTRAGRKLCSSLIKRFERLKDIQDLNESIDISTELIQAAAKENKYPLLRDLGTALLKRHEFTGNDKDLNHAIAEIEKGLGENKSETDLPGDKDGIQLDRTKYILAKCYNQKFERHRSYEDLDNALKYAKGQKRGKKGESGAARHLIHEHLTMWAHVKLNEVYKNPSGEPNETALDAAVGYSKRAVEMISYRHRWNYDVLHTFNIRALIVATKFRVARYLAAKEETQVKKKAASDETYYKSLAAAEERDAKEKATGGEGVKAATIKAAGEKRAAKYKNIEEVRVRKYNAAENKYAKAVAAIVPLIEEAIVRGTEVVETAPREHPQRPAFLHNLSTFLFLKFEFLESSPLHSHLLENSILYAGRAIDTTGPEHTNYALYLNNLSTKLQAQQKGRYDQATYNRIRHCALSALDAKTSPLAHRADAALLSAEYLQNHQKWDDVYVVVKKGLEVLNGLSIKDLSHSDRITILPRYVGLARRGAACALEAGNGNSQSRAIELLQIGRGIIYNWQYRSRGDLEELKRISPGHHERLVKLQANLSKTSVRAAAKTAEDIDDDYYDDSDEEEEEEEGEEGEEGEKTEENKTEEGKTDEEKPEEKKPAIETEDGSDQSNQRNYAEDFEELLSEIRGTSELENFMKPPTEDDIKAAAGNDTIVVLNIHFRCDVFMIQSKEINTLKLEGLTESNVREMADKFRVGKNRVSVLRWLWDKVAKPILTALDIKGPPYGGRDPPRIHWIPTGPLTELPIHAAGNHYYTGTDTVLDWVISSYSPTAKALFYSRRNIENARARDGYVPPTKNLIAFMHETGGSEETSQHLAAAKKEAVSAKESLGDKAHHYIEHPSPKNILELLKTNEINLLHYAGHARAGALIMAQETSTAAVALCTVNMLAGCDLYANPPALAILSGCSTGSSSVNEGAPPNSQDEGLHLVGACLLAGFSNVVGSLWKVQDDLCVPFSKKIYDVLLENNEEKIIKAEKVHRAVHEATKAVKKIKMDFCKTIKGEDVGQSMKEGPTPTTYDEVDDFDHVEWAAYVHMGI